MTHRFFIGYLATAVLFISGCSSQAQDLTGPLADVPPPDELRFITADNATSQCIGDPKTPLCAVETFKACFARNDMKLCRKVGVDSPNLFLGPKQNVSYSVLEQRVLTDADMTKELKNADWWKVGYVDITIIEFFPDVPERKHGQKYSYSVKSAGNEWHIASWAAWGAD